MSPHGLPQKLLTRIVLQLRDPLWPEELQPVWPVAHELVNSGPEDVDL